MFPAFEEKVGRIRIFGVCADPGDGEVYRFTVEANLLNGGRAEFSETVTGFAYENYEFETAKAIIVSRLMERLVRYTGWPELLKLLACK